MLHPMLTHQRDELLGQLTPGKGHSEGFRRAIAGCFDLADTARSRREDIATDRTLSLAERKTAAARLADGRSSAASRVAHGARPRGQGPCRCRARKVPRRHAPARPVRPSRRCRARRGRDLLRSSRDRAGERAEHRPLQRHPDRERLVNGPLSHSRTRQPPQEGAPRPAPHRGSPPSG